MKQFIKVLEQYAEFDGRAGRYEFWMFTLFSAIISSTIALIDFAVGQGVHYYWLYQLAVFSPTLAVGIRRMHDVDKNGWWILIPLANLILAISDGTHGSNRFGKDPRITSPTA